MTCSLILLIHNLEELGSTVSSVSTLPAERTGLDARRGQRLDFSLRYCVHTGSGALPASYPVGTRGSFLWVKQLGHEADH